MPDNTSSAPPAGWYPDPAGSGLERWWGGVDWTETTRAAESAAVPAMALAGAGVGYGAQPSSGYGIGTQPAGGYGPGTDTSGGYGIGSAPSGGFGSVATMAPASTIGSFHAAPADNQFKVAASWYDPKLTARLGPPPENAEADTALILAIVSWIPLFNPLLILTILARVFAKRGLENAKMFEYQAQAPAGRARARWARGLTLVQLIIAALAIAGCGWLYYQVAMYHDYKVETQISQALVDQGIVGATVNCPSDGVTDSGSVIRCSVVLGDGTAGTVQVVINDYIRSNFTMTYVRGEFTAVG